MGPNDLYAVQKYRIRIHQISKSNDNNTLGRVELIKIGLEKVIRILLWKGKSRFIIEETEAKWDQIENDTQKI